MNIKVVERSKYATFKSAKNGLLLMNASLFSRFNSRPFDFRSKEKHSRKRK